MPCTARHVRSSANKVDKVAMKVHFATVALCVALLCIAGCSAQAAKPTTPVTLHYWKIPGRASLSYVLARAGAVPITFIDESAAEVKKTYKTESPFGQLPFLKDADNGVQMAQSAAVAAYVARISGLDGGGALPALAQTLQYIELDAELSQFVGKALYTGEADSAERIKAFDEAKEKIDTKLARVVANLGDNKFLSGSSTPMAADYAIATITWLMSGPTLWPSIKADYPKLAAHFNDVTAANAAAKATFTEMEDWTPYYKRPTAAKAEL